MNSLDPRVNRLPEVGTAGKMIPKVPLDQFVTFEVFVQPKEGKPFQHEGIVHAPSLELAYVLAKETFTRRFSCASLYVVETRDVYVSPMVEGSQNVYDSLPTSAEDGTIHYEIYHLPKRGKQHVHVGSVQAHSIAGAIHQAKLNFGSRATLNVWVIEKNKIRFTSPDEQEIWLTLPDKKFRDASNYKGGDKLNDFLARNTFIQNQN